MKYCSLRPEWSKYCLKIHTSKMDRFWHCISNIERASWRGTIQYRPL